MVPQREAVAGTGPEGMGSDGFDLSGWLRVLSVRRWVWIWTVVVCLLATSAVTFFSTPYHRASARVLIERDNAKMAGIEEIYSLGTSTDDYYLTQHKIMESRAVAEAAFRKLPASDQLWFGEETDPVKGFMGLIRILPVYKSRLVDVLVEHPDPKAAERMAAAVVTAYIENGQERRSGASNEALLRLKADAEDLQAKLMAAEQLCHDFKRKHQIVAMNDRQSLAAARLEKLAQELAEVERLRSEAQARLSSTEVAVKEATFTADLPEVLGNEVIGTHKRALMEARAEQSQLARNYKPMHPRMQALQGRIEAVEHELAREIQSIHKGLGRQLERAVAQELDVIRRMEEQKGILLDLEVKAVEYQVLRDEAEQTRRLHDTVIARLKEIEVIHGYDTTNIHRIGDVEMSTGPVRPRKVLSLLVALLCGLGLGAGLAFAVEHCDRSLKSAADVSMAVGLPVIGTVPRLEGKRKVRGPVDPETLDPRSNLSEAFRTVRTALAFSDVGRDMRSMVVTSTSPEEGKSLVSINLAATFARSGKRVLLIDADQRRPRLQKAFELEVEEGFSSWLLGAKELTELVHETPVENLFVMPCGVIPPNPVELLAAGLTPERFESLRSAFDLVVFDTPPVGIVSDACVLGTMVDRVLFVVRSFSTDRVAARKAVARLSEVGCNLGGVIMNLPDDRADRGGRYEYAYSYNGAYAPLPDSVVGKA